ncbi:intracellular exo-alpha-L-arabinofuranosidase 2 [Clostridia bacterium]|nr:intracellular exo-alpha-L-arabinofuranosidase 2 [Clostridia bacterium]
MQKIIISQDLPRFTIDKNIYGHFSEHLGRCIYEGLYVGEKSSVPNVNGMRTDVVNALKAIKIPVLRWPGGCFADEYHWEDGIGAKEKRKKMINTHWGGVIEDNSFGTHEFFELCRQLGCEPYICGNVGSGTIREMQEWVEYITFGGLSPMAQLREENGQKDPWKIKYWGVGNENWGCGGSMTAEYYANEYKRYATYLRNFSGNSLHKIAGGANSADYHWTEVLMREAKNMMWGLSLHSYTGPQGDRSATKFSEKTYFDTMKSTLKMDELLSKHSTIMDKYDPNKNVALVVDEWGIWTECEPDTNPGFLYQQNSLRDALLAAVNFDIFNKHSDRVKMTNIAQTVNVLQSVALTEGEKMILTPTYHAYRMYTAHHDAKFLPAYFESPDFELDDQKIPAVSVTASQPQSSREINITLTNLDTVKSQEFEIELRGNDGIKSAASEILTADSVTSHNTFEKTDTVKTQSYDGFVLKDGKLTVKLAPKSLTSLKIQ